jgi:hypothetical protein
LSLGFAHCLLGYEIVAAPATESAAKTLSEHSCLGFPSQ